MTDTLQSLRAEAAKTIRKGEADALVLRTWKAAIDSVKARPVAELVGCGSHSCVIAPPRGMGTNGHCQCDSLALRRAVLVLRSRETARLAIDRLDAEDERLVDEMMAGREGKVRKIE